MKVLNCLVGASALSLFTASWIHYDLSRIVDRFESNLSANERPSRVDFADPSEPHLMNIRQLTFGGQNAEAYWNYEGTMLTYQALLPGYPDEQIFMMKQDGSEKRLISTGLGRCTCGYFTPDSKRIYFSSTHEKNPGAQKPVDKSKGYVWMVNPQFSMYSADLNGKDIKPILNKNSYLAETTISPDGKFMVFTGLFDGDLDIYRSNLDGTNIQRLTHEPGYDGGPFVSWDSKNIVYRRDSYKQPEDLQKYKELLSQFLVRPNRLEIWTMDADGKNKRQVTQLGGASFAPFLHPDGKRIIFSSNFEDPKGREFELYMINIDGTGIKRITNSPGFDGFPMFDRTGKKLVWSSNRNGTAPGETNVFVADWKEIPSDKIELEPTDDVWVYPFASNQDKDPFLRIWGPGGVSSAMTFSDEGSVSFALLKFDLKELKGKKISSAEIELTHVEGSKLNAETAKKHPLEVRWVDGDFKETNWNFGEASKLFPEMTESSLLGTATNLSTSERAFPIHISLKINSKAFQKLVQRSEQGQTVCFGLFSSLPAEEVGRDGIYKLYSRSGAPVFRPKLSIRTSS